MVMSASMALEFSVAAQYKSFDRSSNIYGATYNPEEGWLVVEFQSGAVYMYSGVPAEVWAEWKRVYDAGGSAGSYHYHNIRMSYSYNEM